MQMTQHVEMKMTNETFYTILLFFDNFHYRLIMCADDQAPGNYHFSDFFFGKIYFLSLTRVPIPQMNL